MTKAMRAILYALSYGNIEVEAARKLADLKKLDPMRIFLRKADTRIFNGEHEVPVRLYFPSEKSMEEAGAAKSAILFFHGGGWITESVENYNRVCARMAQSTGLLVASVEYRLAPEHRFPTGLGDCYQAAKALFLGELLPDVDPDQIILMGDSAGGNLAAAVSLLARERKDFMPKRQVLIYPALNHCYTADSPYESVRENGKGYLLTSEKMEDYLKLYQRTEADRKNPYFAPLLAEDFSGLPDTLVLTAEFDPLRDEGEEYARRLLEAGGRAELHRIEGAIHGYFALGIQHLYVRESFEYINGFIQGGVYEKDTVLPVEEAGQRSPGLPGSHGEK